MQAEIALPAADRPPHQRARAVAAHDVAGVELSDVGDLAAEMDLDVREPPDALAQDLLEHRLVEVPVVRPALRPRPDDAEPDHQGLTRGTEEVHALRRGPRRQGDVLRQSGRLEDAHHLAVEMHGARQRMDRRVAIVDRDRETGLSQQVRQQRTDRAVPYDGDVVDRAQLRGFLRTRALRPRSASSMNLDLT